MTRHWYFCTIGAALHLSAWACSDNHLSQQTDTVVRDSAGMIIVENLGTGAVEEWWIDSMPFIQLGDIGINTDMGLFNVVGGHRWRSGEVVVANAGTYELVFYDRNGHRAFTAGRRGGGPGEFLAINWMGAVDDSLFVFDSRSDRLSVFSPNGTFSRSFALKPVGGRTPSKAFGFFANGDFFAAVPLVTEAFAPSEEPIRVHSVLVRYDREGNIVSITDTVPDSEHFVQNVPPVLGGVAYWDRAFGLKASVVPVENGYFYGDGERFEITYSDLTGRVLRVIRRIHELIPVSPRHVEVYKERQLRNLTPALRSVAELVLNDMPFPATLPTYSSLAVASDGWLWVESYRVGRSDPAEWTIFDGEGRLRGRIRFQLSLNILEIGKDYILTVYTTSEDEELIYVYTNPVSGG